MSVGTAVGGHRAAVRKAGLERRTRDARLPVRTGRGRRRPVSEWAGDGPGRVGIVEFDRREQRDSRPSGECPAHRIVTADGDVGRQACGRADEQRRPRQQTWASPGASLRQDVERGDQFQRRTRARRRTRRSGSGLSCRYSFSSRSQPSGNPNRFTSRGLATPESLAAPR